MRDRATFKERVALWMRELVHAVASVQESSVTELPRMLCGDVAGTAPALPEIPPLPVGPKERGQCCVTGERMTAPAERLGLDASLDDLDLWYFCPDREDDEQWQPATRPDLPLRNDLGAVVDKETWEAEQAESAKGLWSRPLREWASGRLPPYRLGDTSRDAVEELRQALSLSQELEWWRQLCRNQS